jgi:hypothetical protein
MSTNSPPGVLDLGCFSHRRKEEALVCCTSDQSRSDAGEKAFSSDASSSPNLAEAKKATQQAVQMTCFDKSSHLEVAIRCPIVRKSGKVTTRRVDP